MLLLQEEMLLLLLLHRRRESDVVRVDICRGGWGSGRRSVNTVRGGGVAQGLRTAGAAGNHSGNQKEILIWIGFHVPDLVQLTMKTKQPSA